jgi:hypothetical protein
MVVGLVRQNAILFRGKMQSEGPEGVLDVGIAMVSIDKHCMCVIGEISNVVLCNAILVVGVDPQKEMVWWECSTAMFNFCVAKMPLSQ